MAIEHFQLEGGQLKEEPEAKPASKKRRIRKIYKRYRKCSRGTQ